MPSKAKNQKPAAKKKASAKKAAKPPAKKVAKKAVKTATKKEVRKRSRKAAYPPTRRSLISRLNNWEDRRSWDEFYRTYSKFVFRVACKAGLTEAEASDVVQETFIRVAKNLRDGKFCHDKGSFKAWLMNQARWRIMDQFRGRSKDLSSSQLAPRGEEGDRRTALIENFADPAGDTLEKLWDREWNGNITDLALRAVKAKVSPFQYQIFFCYVIKEWPVERVREHLGVSATQVYLAKHRVGRIMRKEVEKLEKQEL